MLLAAVLLSTILHLDADVVCLQEVAPQSLDDDFAFMRDLGYDEHEMFKKGRFRPATFWKSSRVSLVAPAVHKDRTLLTVFEPVAVRTSRNPRNEPVDPQPRPRDTRDKGKSQEKKQQKQQPQPQQQQQRYWYVLNCHLQAGGQAQRRLRQIMEGIKAVVTAAKKLKGIHCLFARFFKLATEYKNDDI